MLGDIGLVVLGAFLFAQLARYLWGHSLILLSLLYLCVLPRKGEAALPGDSLHHTATDGIAFLGFIAGAGGGAWLAFFTTQGVMVMFVVMSVLGVFLVLEMVLVWLLSFVAWGLCRKVGSIPPEVSWRDFARTLRYLMGGWGWRGSR